MWPTCDSGLVLVQVAAVGVYIYHKLDWDKLVISFSSRNHHPYGVFMVFL